MSAAVLDQFLDYIQSAGTESFDDLQRIRDTITAKLHDLGDELTLERLRGEIESQEVPSKYEAIFRSIQISPLKESSYYKHDWSLGFESLIIEETLTDMQFFNRNVNEYISAYADSKICIQYGESNGRIMLVIKDSGGYSCILSDHRDQEKIAISVLNSFPIFAMIPCLREILPSAIEPGYGNNWIPSLRTPWNGWTHEQLRTLVVDVEDRYNFITRDLGIEPKCKFWGKFCHEQGYKMHTPNRFDTRNDEFIDELQIEWQEMNAKIESLNIDQLTTILGRLKYGWMEDAYDVWVQILDPENKFFRRKKKIANTK